MNGNLAERGSSLVEALVALFLLLVSLVAVGPLFVYATHSGAADADMGRLSALATQRMEELQAVGYASLVVGGAIDRNVAGYFDTSDPGATVRWSVTTNGATNAVRTLSVRAISERRSARPVRTVTLVTRRAR